MSEGSDAEQPRSGSVKVVPHPLVATMLTRLRDRSTEPAEFRRLLRGLTLALFLEASRDTETAAAPCLTPMGEMAGERLAHAPVLVPVLRAGLGMVEPALDLVPEASTYHVGLYRCHETLQPVPYYSPEAANAAGRPAYILDPMLATGGSAVAAIELVKSWRVSRLKLLCILAAPEGIERVQGAHPDVEVVTCAVDERLNEIGYIVPGLGDAGDRQFNT